MTTRYITTSITSLSGPAVTAAAGQDIYVLAGVEVGATDGSIGIADSNDAGTVRVDGYVFSGIAMTGTGGRVIVGSTGLVASGDGGAAISFSQEGALLSNDGHIQGGAGFQSDLSSVVNAGIISNQNSALFFNGSDNSVTNSGVLSGSIFNSTVSFEKGQNDIDNSGTISGEHGAVEDEAGSDSIDNSGTMESGGSNSSTIDLRAGQNTIINSGTISSASGEAISLTGGGSNTIENTNTISAGSEAVTLQSGGNFIANWGTIVSPFSPINLGSQSVSDPTSTIHNFGTLSASIGRDAIYGGTGGGGFDLVNRGQIDGFVDGAFTKGTITVVNSGHIEGGVLLGAAADTYNGTHGDLSGEVDGGGGNDTLKGGVGDDTLNGGAGADKLVGGGGDNVFAYKHVSDSHGASAHDTIVGFDALTDSFNFEVAVTGVNTAIKTGTLDKAAFNADMQAIVTASALHAGHAVLVTASAGDLAGHTYLIVDDNGTAGYQAAADYVIELNQGVHLANLSAANFI